MAMMDAGCGGFDGEQPPAKRHHSDNWYAATWMVENRWSIMTPAQRLRLGIDIGPATLATDRNSQPCSKFSAFLRLIPIIMKILNHKNNNKKLLKGQNSCHFTRKRFFWQILPKN